jgi:hypothetical protein
VDPLATRGARTVAFLPVFRRGVAPSPLWRRG